jgi:hypothetical protein
MMDALKDRRCMDRVSIPAARLYYRITDRHKLLNAYHGPVQISDISKSSLGIDSPLNLKINTHLCLKIIMPDYPEILLKGQILGFLKDRAGKVIRTIIQIMPYGYEPQYNSFKNKKRWEYCLNGKIQVLPE